MRPAPIYHLPLVLLAGLCAALAAPLPAAAQSAPRWTVDHETSSLAFLFTQSGSQYEGRFGRWTAEIAFDPDDLEASAIEVTIEMASADTGSADRDDLLRTAPLFDVANHPQGRFLSEEIVAAGDGYEAHGQLTLRGVAKAVVLPFALEIRNDKAEAAGRLDISRLEFGVGQGQWAATDTVADPVAIVFDIRAARAE